MKKLLLLFTIILTSSLMYSQCWKQVSNGQYHTIAIKTVGTLWAWGQNVFGALGSGNFINSNLPIQIGNSNDWKSISAGAAHSLGIKNDGTLWAWGDNRDGQLGNNSTTNVNTPTQIGTENNWKDVFGGIWVSTAIKNDNSLWGWGLNIGEYQLGKPDRTSNILVPTQIGTDMDWKSISFGGFHTLALKNDNTLWSWGSGQDGEIGDGNLFSVVETPTQLGTSTDWKEISTGFFYSTAIKSDGTLWAWGQYYLPYPTQIGTSSDWLKISSYAHFNLALKNNGTLWSWGDNDYGQLGIGNNQDVSNPTQVGNETYWTAISNGIRFSSVLNSDFELRTFGQNNHGQLGNGSNTDSNVPVNVEC